MAKKQFIPPFPQPQVKKISFFKRLSHGVDDWLKVVYEKSYTLKLGEAKLPALTMFTVGEAGFVNEILYNKQRNFEKHSALSTILLPLLGQSIFTTNGEVWQEQRAMMDKAFDHTSISRSFKLMLDATNDLVARLRAKQAINQEILIDGEMTHVTADIIFRTILSKPLHEEDATQIHQAFTEYQKLAQRKSLLSFYKIPTSNKSLAKYAKSIRDIIKPYIEQRYQAYHSLTPTAKLQYQDNDILDSMLQAKHEKTGKSFNIEELLNQICMVFLAGHETSASALTWALYLIASFPHYQEKLRQEIGEQMVTPTKLRGYTNLKNVFFETLRLYPPVAFFMRQAKCPMTRRGKKIRTRDLLIISPWLLQRSHNHWHNPHEFMPERFDLHDQQAQASCPVHHKSHSDGFLPFSKGDRICVGANFAKQEALIILARILQEFKISYLKDQQPEVISRVTTRPKAAIAIHFENLPSHSS